MTLRCIRCHRKMLHATESRMGKKCELAAAGAKPKAKRLPRLFGPLLKKARVAKRRDTLTANLFEIGAQP